MRPNILWLLALSMSLVVGCPEDEPDDDDVSQDDDDSGSDDDDSGADDDDDDSAGDDDDSSSDDDDSAGDDDDTVACDTRIPQDVATLQAAVDAAGFGDVLCADPGVYPGALDFGGKVVQLIGLGGSAGTTIDGNQAGTVVTFASGESSSTLLQGFTVTDGFATSGGGVLIEGASPTLVDVVVSSNVAYNHGGGIYITAGSPTLDNVVIQGNRADGEGGGLYVTGATLTMSNSVIADNTVMSYGGGLCLQSSSAVLDHLLLVGNVAERDGGGVFMNTSSADVSNVALLGNTAGGLDADGGGIYLLQSSPSLTSVTLAGNVASGCGGGLYLFQASPALLGVILEGNEAASGGGVCNDPGLPGYPSIAFSSASENTPDAYTGMTDPTGANGNTDATANFNQTVLPDPMDWDVHLGETSALIDAGSPSLDDPDGSRSDMGAFGGPAAGEWDLDRDGSPSWWQPGEYDVGSYPGLGWDCDDLDAAIYPGHGC
jgi:predicted outer membrane repeat protein